MGSAARSKRRWTEAEDRALVAAWGEHAIATIAKRLDRSEHAVTMRARVLDLGRAGRGVESIAAFVRRSGYCRPAIFAAAEALGLKLHRALRSSAGGRRGEPRAKHLVVTEEQAEQILDFLREAEKRGQRRIFAPSAVRTARPAWGTGGKPSACLRCGGTERPHYARGLDARCYLAALKRSELGLYGRPATEGDG